MGLLVWQNYARAQPNALPNGATRVVLQPGQMSVAVVRSSTVTLTLPAGASWTTSGTPIVGLPISFTQPSGTQTFNIMASANPGQMAPITASWVDSTGAPQTTTVNVQLT